MVYVWKKINNMEALQHLHSILRWVVLGTALYAIFRAYAGQSGNRSWTSTDNKAGLFFTASLHLQVIIGLILYFGFSPYFQALKDNAAAVMGNAAARFYAVEHISMMLIAVVIATIGRAKSKRGPDNKRHKTALVFFSIALIIILAAIPWPFRQALNGGWF